MHREILRDRRCLSEDTHMSRLSIVFVPALQFALSVIAASDSGSPIVTLDYGSFQGFCSASSTESFLGIPFAQPPYVANNPLEPNRDIAYNSGLEIFVSTNQFPLLL